MPEGPDPKRTRRGQHKQQQRQYTHMTPAVYPPSSPPPSFPVLPAAASALLVAASASLSPFDCWAHLRQAYTGPGALCMLFEKEEEEEKEDNDSDEEKEEGEEEEEKEGDIVMAPCVLKFLDEQLRDTTAPAGFFERPSGGRAAARKHPLHALQHLLHGVLYHRDFSTPVEHNGVRLHSACRPADEAQGRVFRALAAEHGARLLDDNADGRGAAAYYLFGVQIIEKAPGEDAEHETQLEAMTHNGAAAPTAPASPAAAAAAALPLAAAQGRRVRGGRPRKVAAIVAHKGSDQLEEVPPVDLTGTAAAQAAPPQQQRPQRPKYHLQTDKADVLRRKVVSSASALGSALALRKTQPYLWETG